MKISIEFECFNRKIEFVTKNKTRKGIGAGKSKQSRGDKIITFSKSFSCHVMLIEYKLKLRKKCHNPFYIDHCSENQQTLYSYQIWKTPFSK